MKSIYIRRVNERKRTSPWIMETEFRVQQGMNRRNTDEDAGLPPWIGFFNPGPSPLAFLIPPRITVSLTYNPMLITLMALTCERHFSPCFPCPFRVCVIPSENATREYVTRARWTSVRLEWAGMLECGALGMRCGGRGVALCEGHGQRSLKGRGRSCDKRNACRSLCHWCEHD